MAMPDAEVSESEGSSDEEFKVITGNVEMRCPKTDFSKACSLVLRANQVKTVDEKLFVNLQVRKYSIRRLLTWKLDISPNTIWTAMKPIKICDDLMKIKNKSVRRVVVGSMTASPMKSKSRLRLKKHIVNKLQLPNIVSITAPDVGGVRGIDMNVLATPAGGKGHGLLMELIPANLNYLTDAAAAQWAEANDNRDQAEDEVVDDATSIPPEEISTSSQSPKPVGVMAMLQRKRTCE